MNHWKARHRLPELLDQSLAPEVEAELRVHVADCARCTRQLAELELCDALIRRMPHSIAPLDARPSAHARLVRLARWTDEPELPGRERWRAPALGLAGLVMAALMGVTVGTWSPVVDENHLLSLSIMPQESAGIPAVWRPGR